MNIEPCVRLGMRISPKISENPAESRNNRPPNVTLLTVSSSQNVITAALPSRGLSALGQWRIIARIDWMCEKLLLGPGPELTHVLIGLDGFVPKLEAVFGAFRANAPDVEVSDHVVEVIELERSARRIGQADSLQGCHELVFIAGIGARSLQAGIDDLAINVEQPGVLTGNRIEIFQHAIDEALIGVVLQIERVGTEADQADRLLAIA